MLVAVSVAVVLLMVVCGLGGYLWGHKDMSKIQRERDGANTKLVVIRQGVAPMRSDLQDSMSRLDAASLQLHGCENTNQLLLIAVSSRTAPRPGF